MSSSSYDFIVVGGGLAGCTVAARLQQNLPSASVLIIEAGDDETNHPLATKPLAGIKLQKSPLDWNLRTVPQSNLDGQPRYQAAGKALSGGTVINYATWTRGAKVDYDNWGKVVGDDRWSYDQLEPYFPKSETRSANEETLPESHGRAGVIYTATVAESHPHRKYPLREPVKKAWENTGIAYNAHPNGGNPLGLSERVENWNQGKRQFTHRIYHLATEHARLKTRATKILVTEHDGEKVVTGVEVQSGETIFARKEVILSCGAYHSPQLLLLSGIGPAADLQELGISLVVDSPEVGHNFYDNLAVPLIWKLKNREHDLPPMMLAKDPVLGLGFPSDWVVFAGLDSEKINQALAKDNQDKDGSEVSKSLLDPRNCFTETLNFYVPAGAEIAEMKDIPMDGSFISSPVLGMLPTSRGRISLASKDPFTPPKIDPNYYATELDRVVIRNGVREALRVYQSDVLKDIIETETPPEGFAPLHAASTDEEIDARVARVGITFFHPAGSCAMGKVVDTELRAYGLKGLRVVDASVLPTPIAAHLQVPVYALAERAASFIIQEHR